MRRAAIYCRISDDREGAGLGVARQEADCRERAERLGWSVAGLYVDNDLSAYSGKLRPGYQKMVADLRAGVADAVIAWHTDRLHRSPRELEEFIDICETEGIAVETVKAGPVDLSTPAGRAVARTLGAWARYESEHRAERIRRKALELAYAGKIPGGGTRPYGYEEDRLTVRESEAVVIRECVRRVLAGEAVRTVVRDLNRRQVPGSTGKQWSAQTLKRILVSGRISGQREYQPRSRSETKRRIAGEIVSDAIWPAIIGKEETARLRALLLDASRRLTSPIPRRCLLTGILRCGLCGASLCGRPRGDGQMRYVCNRVPGNNRCGRIYVLTEPTDQLIGQMVKIVMDSPQGLEALVDKKQDQQDTELLARMSTDQRKLEELADDYANDAITRAEWLTARERLATRLEAVRRQLAANTRFAALDGLSGHSEGFGEVWDRLTQERRRAVIAALLDRIIVHPAVRGRNTFDPHRFEPIWRA